MISNTKFVAVENSLELLRRLLICMAARMGDELENHLNRDTEWALGTILFVGLVWEKWVNGGVSHENSFKMLLHTLRSPA